MTDVDHVVPAGRCSCELQTSAALLISVFGQPIHAGADVVSYRWQLSFEDGAQARIFTQQGGHPSAATLLIWRVEADSAAALARVEQSMQAGADYYEGTLHPELFIRRDA
jgi:hypothetical protein